MISLKVLLFKSIVEILKKKYFSPSSHWPYYTPLIDCSFNKMTLTLGEMGSFKAQPQAKAVLTFISGNQEKLVQLEQFSSCHAIIDLFFKVCQS